MKGTTLNTAVLDIPEVTITALQRKQQILVITETKTEGALQLLAEIEILAREAGLDHEITRSRGLQRLRVRECGGSVQILTRRQATQYGALRGQSADLVLYGDDELLPEILPVLLVRRGLAVNYLDGSTIHPS